SSSRLGSLLLTGSITLFAEQSLAQRQAVLASWQLSRITPLRIMAKSFLILSQKAYTQNSLLFAQAIGYTDTPASYKKTTSYPFLFLTFPPGDAPVDISTDVVIVGSGPGGSVSAARLATAGHRVLVVDKGRAFSTSSFPMTQAAAEFHMFENHGLVSTEESSLAIMAGSTWGGGGTINWGVSLRTPRAVRREWAEADGLDMFVSEAYEQALDAVCKGICASTEYPINSRGQALIDAARLLGHDAEKLPLNSGQDENHACGRCHMGCGSNSKMGPIASWLPRAADKGTQFMDGLVVDKVLFAADGKTAVGVEGRWTPREGGYERRVRVRAKRVVISAGSLWSPVILKKSGITNPMVGQNLHTHPAMFVVASRGEEINPWEGPIMPSIVTSLENLDGAYHGARIEPSAALPFMCLAGIPWSSGPSHRARLLHAPSLAPYVVFIRENQPGGRISVDPTTGAPVPHYTLNASTRSHMMTGTIALARMLYAHGVQTITVGIPSLRTFERPEAARADVAFAAWLKELIEQDLANVAGLTVSAHQMGSCRMSANPKRGVVDPTGKVYGTKGLYVADASVFPSASGVNPMVTVMATAWHISDCITEDLRKAA
ncbi:hypothetical protein TD95_005322, partial [Thielaviopsis punctulata]